jgi:2-oxoglutarate ferredoxin oxidoreductase subunit alpha
MARTSISIVFAGSGGSGAMTAGSLFLQAAAGAGYFGTMTQLFGAQVRGGESAALVQLSTEPVESQPDRFDVFVALDWEKVDQFAPEIPLDQNSVVIADPAAGAMPASIGKSEPRLMPTSFDDPRETRLERALRGRHVNVCAAALAGTLIGLAPAYLEAALRKVLGSKRAEVLESNARALALGIEKAKDLKLDLTLEKPKPSPRWLITGNQGIALGALRGGVRFVGCYPITPATDLVEWLAPNMRAVGGNLVLAEDELASINMVLGASYAGVPAMTVTAGPGLSLMTEAIGLGVAAEIPAVIVDVMRAGPSTGIASKTEQSDLNIAIYGGHGDAPRIVVAPLSVADCATTGEWAVYIAESMQTPVLVLSDQMFGQARSAIPLPEHRPPVATRRVNGVAPAQFKRYATTGDPVTPMPHPGTIGLEWVAEGLTHNEAGLPVSGAAPHTAQMNKRAKKIAQFDPGALWGEVYGDGETAILTFGSSVAPAREAARRLTAAGHPTRVVALRVLSPVPMKQLQAALKGTERVVVLEQNMSGQLLRHLLGNRALDASAESIARPGPLPFRPAEITAHLA